MANEKILIVDDEQDILELLNYNLGREGYQVFSAETGEQAYDLANKKWPDLIILDLMLPGIDGLEVCRRLRKNAGTETIPIIMLTAKGEEADIVTGLELGADDYVTKPFSPKVLLSRVRSVLRRKKDRTEAGDVIRARDLVIDRTRHEVLAAGVPVELTFTEFRILEILANKPGRVFTRDQIVDKVHGNEYIVTDRTVDVQIVSLRKKLGSTGQYIETVRGVGYRFGD
jgi:two-component system phosphate regulon response regulator PhoB